MEALDLTPDTTTVEGGFELSLNPEVLIESRPSVRVASKLWDEQSSVSWLSGTGWSRWKEFWDYYQRGLNGEDVSSITTTLGTAFIQDAGEVFDVELVAKWLFGWQSNPLLLDYLLE